MLACVVAAVIRSDIAILANAVVVVVPDTKGVALAAALKADMVKFNDVSVYTTTPSVYSARRW